MFGNILVFLLETVLGLLTFLFVLRFLMQWTRTSFHNPLGQMTVALTDFLVKPTRRWVPSVKKVDVSTLVLALAVQWLLFLILPLLMGFAPMVTAALWQAVIGVLKQVLDVFFYAILLMAILSWINPYHAIYGVLQQLASPILDPLRRLLPAIQGFDFSALVALLLIQIVSRFILPSLAGGLL